MDGISMLKQIGDGTVDLVLTDPPYIISKETGMNKVFDDAQKGIVKSKYGTKYAIQTNYGDWDSKFTLESLIEFINEFYRILRKGGTCIIFFDLWKIETLSKILTDAGFTKIRMIEWIKTNPVPINSKVSYLNNAREIALVCGKGVKQTFNSKYDVGIYEFPIFRGENGIKRFHPTQKSLDLFEELIKKHSNSGDVVVDPFGGSGTTFVASIKTGRRCISCEARADFHKKTLARISTHTKKPPKSEDGTFFE